MYWPKEPYMKKLKKKKEFHMHLKLVIKLEHPIHKKSFQREYDSRQTAEIFKINRRFMRQGPPIYTVVDWYDKPVEGTLYQKELQKVESTDDNLFKIETILKYKGRGKDKQALVKWKGWPKKLNSWIPASNAVTFKK